MADEAPSELLSRRHQMFPLLTDAEIARIRRFGTVQHYRRGDRLFAVILSTVVALRIRTPSSSPLLSSIWLNRR